MSIVWELDPSYVEGPPWETALKEAFPTIIYIYVATIPFSLVVGSKNRKKAETEVRWI